MCRVKTDGQIESIVAKAAWTRVCKKKNRRVNLVSRGVVYAFAKHEAVTEALMRRVVAQHWSAHRRYDNAVDVAYPVF